MKAFAALLGLVPPWAALGAAAIAVATLCAWSWAAGARHAEAKHTAAALKQAAAALKQAEDNAAETKRRINTIEEARRAAELRTHQAIVDAADAANAAKRLRQQLDAYVSAARAHPAAPGRCEATGDPIGVLADMLSRCDARTGVVARYADAAREAGRLCEQSFDALE